MTSPSKTRGSLGSNNDDPLTTWLEFYKDEIEFTTENLMREVTVIDNRKVKKNAITLKDERKPETVRLGKSIVMGYNDAISKALKNLQTLSVNMTKELQQRFNLPEEWLKASCMVDLIPSPTNPSEDSGLDKSNNEEVSDTLSNASGEQKEKDPEPIRECEDVSNEVPEDNTEFIAEATFEGDESIGIVGNGEDDLNLIDSILSEVGVTSVPQPFLNGEVGVENQSYNVEEDDFQDALVELNEETIDTDNKSDNESEKSDESSTSTASRKKHKIKIRPRVPDSDEETSDKERNEKTPRKRYLSKTSSTSQKKKKPEKSDSNSEKEGKSSRKSTPRKSDERTPKKDKNKEKTDHEESSAEESEKKDAAKKKSSRTSTPRKSDAEEKTPKKSSKKKADEIGDVDLFPDTESEDDQNKEEADTTIVCEGAEEDPLAEPMSDFVRVEAPSSPAIKIIDLDKIQSPSSTSEDEKPGVKIEKSLHISPRKLRIRQKKEDSKSKSSDEERESRKQHLNRPARSARSHGIKRDKEELEAMREVLKSSGSSLDSDTDEVDKRAVRKKRDEQKVKKEVKEPIDWKKDPKLKKGAATVKVEKLAENVEKALAAQNYVTLEGYETMFGMDSKKLANVGDSDSTSADSDDSVGKLSKALKQLTKTSIIRTRKYDKTSGRQNRPKVKKEKSPRKRKEKDGDEELNDSGSDVAAENLVNNGSPIGSCTESEDLEKGSDDDSSGKKNRAGSGRPSRATDKKRKNYKTVTITSSDEDSEKDNKKAVLGSDSDSNASAKSTKKVSTKRQKKRSSHSSDSDFKPTGQSKSKTKRRRLKGSSSSEASAKSDNSDDDSDDSDFEDKKSSAEKKKKRKRIKRNSDSEKSDDSDIKEVPNEDNDDEPSSSQKGRKKIRKIMSKHNISKSTKEAEKEEEERKKRVVERQNMFNGIHKATESDKIEKLILEVDPETKDPVLEVDETIVSKLKPHQAEGIKFMYNACFESLEMIKQNKVPGGCILAHCMGLGKTLQTVAFIHTLLTNEACKTKTALVICPLSTVNNWYAEVKKWTKDAAHVNVHKLYDCGSSNKNRCDALQYWKRRGGVGIMHYDLFRRLADPKGTSMKKVSKSLKERIHQNLLDPGPDIVICDEGHQLKNNKSLLSLAVNMLRSQRRIVLTGTPLQNNLTEYHTMMNFVKPNLLGSLQEFTNRFVNPIKNGQHADSTDHDVKVMKRRAHVLHSKLDGCVQRKDYSTLAPYLPPKYEYIISIKLSEKQVELYKYYLDNIVDPDLTARKRQLLKYYAELVKIWSHPIALTMRKVKDEKSDESDEGSIKDFICDETTSESEAKSDDDESRSSSGKEKKGKRRTRAQPGSDLEPELEEKAPDKSTMNNWWSAIFKSKSEMNDVELSSKLVVLQEILKTCESIGDKVLVFSQYLTSLNIIEECLGNWDAEALEQEKKDRENEEIIFPMNTKPVAGRWRKNIEYFRLDGGTKVSDRHKDCEKFNTKSAMSRAKLFLISTKAGGLGINLFGANRVIIFDASWNPSQDMQSIFRVYRFGQDKPCYIYRLIARGTMEEKILRRQITKLSLSSRVVDEHQIERHFKFDDVNEMYVYEEAADPPKDSLAVPKDRLLADLLMSNGEWIKSYEEFNSLLINKVEEELTNEEKEAAWKEFRDDTERKRIVYAPQQQYQDAATALKIRERLFALHPQASEIDIIRGMGIILDVIDKIKILTLNMSSRSELSPEVRTVVEHLNGWLRDCVGPRPEPYESPPPGALLPPLPVDRVYLQRLVQIQGVLRQQQYQAMLAGYQQQGGMQMQYQRAPVPPILRAQLTNPGLPQPRVQHIQNNIRNIAATHLLGNKPNGRMTVRDMRRQQINRNGNQHPGPSSS